MRKDSHCDEKKFSLYGEKILITMRINSHYGENNPLPE